MEGEIHVYEVTIPPVQDERDGMKFAGTRPNCQMRLNDLYAMGYITRNEWSRSFDRLSAPSAQSVAQAMGGG